MEDKLKQLYEMLFSPIITPYNLLENAKLDNYKYVKYTKGDTGLLVSMECEIEPGFNAQFFYHFDAKDHLLLVVMESDEGQEIIFDRQQEVQILKDRLLDNNKDKVALQAI